MGCIKNLVLKLSHFLLSSIGTILKITVLAVLLFDFLVQFAGSGPSPRGVESAFRGLAVLFDNRVEMDETF
jgi:hypothetical protein